MNKKYILFLCCFSSFAHGTNSLTRFVRQAAGRLPRQLSSQFSKKSLSTKPPKEHPLSESSVKEALAQRVISAIDTENQNVHNAHKKIFEIRDSIFAAKIALDEAKKDLIKAQKNRTLLEKLCKYAYTKSYQRYLEKIERYPSFYKGDS
jgi:hypothetical protein